MSIVIRPATVADAADLAALGAKTFFDTFGHLYPPEDAAYFNAQRFSVERAVADIGEAGRYIQLAFQADALVGFLDCGDMGLPLATPKPNACELSRLYLDKPAIGSGLAKALMEMAIAWAHDRSAQALYLSVYHDNLRAQAFYRKFGFEIVGAYQFKVGNTLDDERIMELILR
jgi:diamine N-acetyltransferase